MTGLRIAVDASRTTLARRTGTENYALQLIRALLQLPSPHHFDLYFRDTPPPDLFPPAPNIQSHVIPFRRAWTHVRFAAALRRSRPDVTFVPAHTLPILFPGRAVVTVHDVGYRFFPAAHPPRVRAYLELTTRYSARRAARVIAVSAATKKDLVVEYGTAAEKIDVIYPGVEGLSRAEPDQIEAARARYSLPARYFLFVGTLQPRKNIERLAQAFARYLEMSGDTEIGLVLAGQSGWLLNFDSDIRPNLPEAAQARIRVTGYIPDSDIAAVYSGALALTFPSLYEGFGFPVLEAMRCGTPAICANTSSLPELAGDAALLVDPLDVEALAAAMQRMASDSALRAELAARGLAQAARFTWNAAAQGTLHVLETAATL